MKKKQALGVSKKKAHGVMPRERDKEGGERSTNTRGIKKNNAGNYGRPDEHDAAVVGFSLGFSLGLV